VAYTIKITGRTRAETVKRALDEKVKRDGRFTCRTDARGDHVVVQRVRHTTARRYCGQHAGPCDIPRPFQRKKPVGKWLEWFDWIEFNGLVNDVLDAIERRSKHAAFEAWSTPMDTALEDPATRKYERKLWVRRDNRRRLHYDVRRGFLGDVVRFEAYIADYGSPSQFEEHAA